MLPVATLRHGCVDGLTYRLLLPRRYGVGPARTENWSAALRARTSSLSATSPHRLPAAASTQVLSASTSLPAASMSESKAIQSPPCWVYCPGLHGSRAQCDAMIGA